MEQKPPQRVFDLLLYQQLIVSRESFLRRVLPHLQRELSLRRALDAGCGIGFFSSLLGSLGFRVVAFDGRQDNVDEATRRYPGIDFRTADVEELVPPELGSFDLVLCFGLLYHLENPFRAVRNLHALTAKVLLIESMCIPDKRVLLEFRDEGPSEDQGLRNMAFYPTEACLVKMLYRAGFTSVCRFLDLPDHPDFHAGVSRNRVRCLLLASCVPLSLPFLAEVREPATRPDPWATRISSVQERLQRVGSFLRKPLPEKWASVQRRLGKGRA